MIVGGASAGAAGAAASLRGPRRDGIVLRPRKPLSQRELNSLYARITKRIGRGGGAFGVFVLKDGRKRVFKLISTKHADYARQLGREKVQQHMIATYDVRVSFADVWADLCAFDRPSSQ